MKNSIFFIYLLILAGTTYLIRVIPFTAIKEKINNRFVRSFLYYIPYAVLTALIRRSGRIFPRIAPINVPNAQPR